MSGLWTGMRKMVIQTEIVLISDLVAPSKLGKGGGTTELKPFSVTLWVSNPIWKSVAATRSEFCMVRGDLDREA